MFNDSFQNFKSYQLPKAQLVIADIPYQLGTNAYGSNPAWYVDGDNKNGESAKAKSSFFDTDSKEGFRITEFFHFCQNMLIKEPKETGKSPCMIIFCAFEQQFDLIAEAAKCGFPNYINLVIRKNFSAQVLKANMRVVGNCEYALIFYRNKLPKFNNEGKMAFNCIDCERDTNTPKIHPTQKPVGLLEYLIRLFTDVNDVVIDPVAGSGTTLLAASNLNRRAYGFEIKKEFVKGFNEILLPLINEDVITWGEHKTLIERKNAFRQPEIQI
jgi:site-specific DNA-methyltransferase (adenine-specific)